LTSIEVKRLANHDNESLIREIQRVAHLVGGEVILRFHEVGVKRERE